MTALKTARKEQWKPQDIIIGFNSKNEYFMWQIIEINSTNIKVEFIKSNRNFNTYKYRVEINPVWALLSNTFRLITPMEKIKYL